MIGNNCGHIPENPRWFSPPEKHKRPKILTEIQQRIRQYYQKPAQLLPLLCYIYGNKSKKSKKRQQRSERREACINVLACLLHYMDLTTLRVGIPQTDGSFKGIDMRFIAERCGLNLRRVERAMNDLVKSGLVTVHPLCEKISEIAYKGYAAIRTISKQLFTIFSLEGRLRHERERASERQKKKNRKAEAKGRANIDLALKSACAHMDTGNLSARSRAFREMHATLDSS